MKNVPENELFSAYLDGELSAAERAEVEQLLAKDPSARQLLGELRALSSTLRALPTQKLDGNLSQQILRAAERRMLTEPVDSSGEHGSQPEGTSFWRLVGRRLLQPRNLFWPAAVIAASLLLYFGNPEPEAGRTPAPPQNKIASAPRHSEPAPDAQPSTPSIGPLPESHPEQNPAETNRAVAKSPAIEKSVPEQPPPHARLSSKPSAPPPTSAIAKTDTGSSGKGGAGPSATEMKTEASQAKGPENNAFVVHCDVTDATAAKKLLSQILEKHRIPSTALPAANGAETPSTTTLAFEASREQVDAVVRELKAEPRFVAVSVPSGVEESAENVGAAKVAMGLKKNPSPDTNVRIGLSPGAKKQGADALVNQDTSSNTGSRVIEVRPKNGAPQNGISLQIKTAPGAGNDRLETHVEAPSASKPTANTPTPGQKSEDAGKRRVRFVLHVVPPKTEAPRALLNSSPASE